jgi:hypothetical protein
LQTLAFFLLRTILIFGYGSRIYSSTDGHADDDILSGLGITIWIYFADESLKQNPATVFRVMHRLFGKGLFFPRLPCLFLSVIPA